VKKVKPTHRVIQTKAGAKFALGFCWPKRPLSTTSKKSVTVTERKEAQPRKERPDGKQRLHRADPKEVEAGIAGSCLAFIDEEADRGEGEQHRRGRAVEVELDGKGQVVASPDPVSESQTGRREQEEGEGQDEETPHNRCS
jgi:hypothetical protein